ncbi:MAG: malonyl-CoA O-methyltransferase, partial [Saprospiraceae bacterium]
MTLNNKLTVYKHPCKGELLQPEPLVLIHGWGSDSHTWDLILPELMKNFNVLAIDLPGFGESEYFQQEVG